MYLYIMYVCIYILCIYVCGYMLHYMFITPYYILHLISILISACCLLLYCVIIDSKLSPETYFLAYT